MTTENLLLFCAVAFIAIATPGPTVLLALTNGSRFGVRASVAGMLGAVVSDVVLVSAVAVGLGALLAASELLFSTVKWIGVAYLAYLGLRLIRSKGTLAVPAADGAAATGNARTIFLRSFLVAVTNPKGYLFCSALLPQFVNTGEPVAAQYVTLGLAFAGIDFAVMFAYACVGMQAVRVLRDKGLLWLERLSGASLLALSGSLALVRRQP